MKISVPVTLFTEDGEVTPMTPVEIKDKAEALSLIERFGGEVVEDEAPAKSDGKTAPPKN